MRSDCFLMLNTSAVTKVIEVTGWNDVALKFLFFLNGAKTFFLSTFFLIVKILSAIFLISNVIALHFVQEIMFYFHLSNFG